MGTKITASLLALILSSLATSVVNMSFMDWFNSWDYYLLYFLCSYFEIFKSLVWLTKSGMN